MLRALAFAVLVACSSAPREVELVESAPIESTLDLSDVRNATDVWPALLGEARTSIDLAQFYVSNAPSSALEPVLASLEAARGRGVRVRLLVEKSFTSVYPESLERLRHAGCEVRALDLSALGGILHAKYFVVDGRVAFLGSQNFDWRALEHNAELGAIVRERGVVVRLAYLFGLDWARAGGSTPPAPPAFPESSTQLELVASPRDMLPAGIRWDLPQLVALIDGARSHVRAQMLTYKAGDWDELDRPLRAAAARGVKVELAVADWVTRPGTLPSVQALARAGVEVRIVRIPAWSGGFIPFARVAHAKLLVVDDDRGWLGTSNWEREYFYANRNVGLIVRDPSFARQLLRYSDGLWSTRYATRLDPDKAYTPPRIE